MHHFLRRDFGAAGEVLIEGWPAIVAEWSSTWINAYVPEQAGPGVVGVGGGGEGFYVDAPYRGPTTNVVNRGSIMVKVKDPATRKLIWQGNARTTIDPDAPEAVRRAAVQQAISGIMSKFPAAG